MATAKRDSIGGKKASSKQSRSSKDVPEPDELAWKAGWDRAHKIALKTLSGIALLVPDSEYANARFRAFQASAKIWERLCSRELRTVAEVKDAAKKIGEHFKKGNQVLIAAGEGPIYFNQYQWEKSKSQRVYTELEWMADIYNLASGENGPYQASLIRFDLEGWKPWEVMYVTGLRAIDAAARVILAGDPELGMSLIYDALNEMYMCDVFASGNERNKKYDEWSARIYGFQRPDFDLAEKVNERVNERVGEAVKEAIKTDRKQLAKAAAAKKNEKNRRMREFVIECWYKEKRGLLQTEWVILMHFR